MNQQPGRFHILAELGHGAFGTVYRALDTTLNVERAIKILNPVLLTERRIVDDFYREAQVVARLRHPNIVAVHDVLNEQGRLSIVMDLMQGGSLADRLAKDGPMSLAQVVPILGQIADALTYAHDKGMVHCDIKPQNILFDEYGMAHLSDFGLARSSDGSSASAMSSRNSGQNSGTLAYMAPELFDDDKPTPASDVYALACVMYEMLTGKVLFEGSTLMAVMKKHAAGADLSAIAQPKVRQTLASALCAQPRERAGVQELVQKLDEVLAPMVTARPASATPPPVQTPLPQKATIANPVVTKQAQPDTYKLTLVFGIGVIALLCGGGIYLLSLLIQQANITRQTPTPNAVAVTLATFTFTPTSSGKAETPTATPIPPTLTPQPTAGLRRAASTALPIATSQPTETPIFVPTVISSSVVWSLNPGLPQHMGFIGWKSTETIDYPSGIWTREVRVSLRPDQLALIFGGLANVPTVGEIGTKTSCFILVTRGPLDFSLDLMSARYEKIDIEDTADSRYWAAEKSKVMSEVYPSTCGKGIDIVVGK